MEENKFKVAFNDVDFCLKILEKGYRIVYNPYIELYHFESNKKSNHTETLSTFSTKYYNY